MNKLEYRNFKAKVSVRTDDESSNVGTMRLTGYAATFDNPSQDLGGYIEVLAPGCFTQSLAENDVRAFWHHDMNTLPLGRTSAGNLKLTEDATGLAFEIELPDTQLARDLYKCVSLGLVDGVSFGFFARKDSWSEDGLVNTIEDADLLEISPVNFPAYLQTSVEARSLERLSRRPRPTPKLNRARIIMRMDDEN